MCVFSIDGEKKSSIDVCITSRKECNVDYMICICS